MNRAFVITVVLLLSPFPAFSQTAAGGEGRDSSYSRKDRDLEDVLRGIGDHGREGTDDDEHVLAGVGGSCEHLELGDEAPGERDAGLRQHEQHQERSEHRAS